MFRIPQDQDVDVMRRGVLQLLERVGFHVDNREDQLAKARAMVERARRELGAP